MLSDHPDREHRGRTHDEVGKAFVVDDLER